MRFTSALFLVLLHLPEWRGIGIGLDKSIHTVRRDRAPGVVDAFSAYDSGLPSNDPTKPETPSTLFTSPNIYICPLSTSLSTNKDISLYQNPLTTFTVFASIMGTTSILRSISPAWHTPISHTSVFRIRQRHRGRHSSITINNDLTSFGDHGRRSCFIFSTSLDSWSLNLHVLYHYDRLNQSSITEIWTIRITSHKCNVWSEVIRLQQVRIMVWMSANLR